MEDHGGAHNAGQSSILADEYTVIPYILILPGESFQIEPEYGALNQPGSQNHLGQGQIRPPDPVGLFSVLQGMFFRPEENALRSERFDNARFLKFKQVDVRNKNQGFIFIVDQLVLQVAIYLKRDGLAAMGATGINPNLQAIFPKSPLHEGRRHGVGRSGRVDRFSCLKCNKVRGKGGRYRIRP